MYLFFQINNCNTLKKIKGHQEDGGMYRKRSHIDKCIFMQFNFPL